MSEVGEAMATLRMLQDQLSGAVEDVKEILGSHFRVMIVAYVPGSETRDISIGDMTIDAAIESLERSKKPYTVLPGNVPVYEK